MIRINHQFTGWWLSQPSEKKSSSVWMAKFRNSQLNGKNQIQTTKQVDVGLPELGVAPRWFLFGKIPSKNGWWLGVPPGLRKQWMMTRGTIMKNGDFTCTFAISLDFDGKLDRIFWTSPTWWFNQSTTVDPKMTCLQSRPQALGADFGLELGRASWSRPTWGAPRAPRNHPVKWDFHL